jgi:hypothetical protein
MGMKKGGVIHLSSKKIKSDHPNMVRQEKRGKEVKINIQAIFVFERGSHVKSKTEKG